MTSSLTTGAWSHKVSTTLTQCCTWRKGGLDAKWSFLRTPNATLFHRLQKAACWLRCADFVTTQDYCRKRFPLLRSCLTAPPHQQEDPPTHPPPPWAPGASPGPSQAYPPRPPHSGVEGVLRPLGLSRQGPRPLGPRQAACRALCGPPCRPMGPHSISSSSRRGTPGDRAEGCLPAQPPLLHSYSLGPPHLGALGPPPFNSNHRLCCDISGRWRI